MYSPERPLHYITIRKFTFLRVSQTTVLCICNVCTLPTYVTDIITEAPKKYRRVGVTQKIRMYVDIKVSIS